MGEGKRVPRLTGILQRISVLLEFDAHICAIAEQRRIAGIARYRFGIQLCGSQKVAGYFGRGRVISGAEECNWIFPSVHENAWFASALSLAACCLSPSVISLGSAKLSVDSVEDGMTDEGRVVEEREEDDDSLMLTINTPSATRMLALLNPILFVLVLIRSGQTQSSSISHLLR